MSKGSSRRPCLVSKEEADRNFETIFGKKKSNQAERAQAKIKKLPFMVGRSNDGWVYVKDLEKLIAKLIENDIELSADTPVDDVSVIDLSTLL